MKKIAPFLPLIILFFVAMLFFRQFFLQGYLPIPADALVGLYHPYRDLYADTNPNGIAYKNFLITDPVRQQYPWRYIAVGDEKGAQFPLWNPYNGGGEPLFGNIQSAILYPLNVLLLITPFNVGWSLLIFLQLILGGAFMYSYLKNRKLSDEAAFLGSVSYIFSGFFIAWLTWNTLVHVALWLPLSLLAVDKILTAKNAKHILLWCVALILGLTFAFFAGHLQTYFYLSILITAYALLEVFSHKNKIAKIALFFGVVINIFVLISVQLFSTFQLILQSAREADQKFLVDKEGWFIPWKHLIQFIAPDFFGNPATLNYFGTWNYGEMIGYIGLIPLFFACYALLKKNKHVLFFWGVIIISLIFALPTIVAKLPFLLSIPLISTSQPTRLIVLIDFSLCVLAAYGFQSFLKNNSFDRRSIMLYGVFLFIFVALWAYVSVAHSSGNAADFLVARRNLFIPTALFGLLGFFLVAFIFIKNKKLIFLAVVVLLAVTTLDLLRFAGKFTPFVDPKYVFPQTKTISYLQKQSETYPWRFLGVDYAANQKRILPPNVTAYYQLYTLDTYNPLLLQVLQNYAAASEFGVVRGESVSFNRIVALNNYGSRLIDLSGTKYIASLADIKNSSYVLKLREGETRVYENKNAYPRAFMVYDYIVVSDNEAAAGKLLDKSVDLKQTAVLYKAPSFSKTTQASNTVTIDTYTENSVVLTVRTDKAGLLLLTDAFYPTWKVKVDGNKSEILQTDILYRGVVVPKGKHEIKFYTNFL